MSGTPDKTVSRADSWWKDGERWIAANGALTSTVPTRVTVVITVKR